MSKLGQAAYLPKSMTFFPIEEQFKHKVPESLVCIIEEAQVETSPNNPLTQLNSV